MEKRKIIQAKRNPIRKYSNKLARTSVIIRRLFMVNCFLVFGYQSFKICSEFYSYETMIIINNNRPPDVDIPGLTICFNLERESKYNTTTPWQFLTNSPTLRNNSCYIWGPAIKNGTKTEYWSLCEEFSSIIVSTVYKRGKCFTYFSQLELKSIDKKAVNQMKWYSYIAIELRSDDLKAFYGETLRGVNFFLHSPFMIPSERFSDQIIVSPRKIVDVKYSSIDTHFLKYPHKTNCTDYGLETEMGSPSQPKCFQDCYTGNRKKRCQCLTHNMYNDVHQLENITQSDQYCDQQKEVECGLEEQTIEWCRGQCPLSCYDDQYIFSSSLTNFNKEPTIRINIRHSKQSHDLSIEHKQIMNFFVFLANLGGIAGLWFGISIITLYDKIILFSTLLIRKYKSIKTVID